MTLQRAKSRKRTIPRPAKARVSAARRSAEAMGAAGGRERLLEAALRLFASKGYTATSVRDIVSAAGVTAPSLYHHFGNKEGLFLAIMRESQLRIEAVQREALAAGGSVAVRILRLSRAYVALRREFADFAWVVVRIVSGPRKAAPRFDFRALALKKIRQFEQLIEEGVVSGEFGPCLPRPVALALAGAIEMASRPHLFDSSGGGSDGALEAMVAVILSGITAGRTRRAPRRGMAAVPAAES
jgi:AcrR family transcriptional regulator